MAFSLEVQTQNRPTDVCGMWTSALAKRGIVAEFPPNFSIESSQGLLVIKVLSAPAHLVGIDLAEVVAAYFQVWIDEDGFCFSTASGRTTVDFSTQCLCAAALAEDLNAVYFDPQLDESAKGADAYRLAMSEIESFISEPGETVHRTFIDWETI
ncbi:MAG: hypothetical protein H7293_02840 [Candidatus Saccharibacteria bacterium]|nr:hypothetical protein [Rhodoferax sp.]